MNLKGIHDKFRNKEPIVHQQKLYEVFSLLSAIITPIFVLAWIKLSPELAAPLRSASWLIAFYFILLYCSIYFSYYVRKQLRYFLYGGYYAVSAFAVYLSYLNLYAEQYFLLMMLVIFYISLTFSKIKDLAYYLITILILVGFSTYAAGNTAESYYRNGLVFSICLFVFFIMAFVNLFLRKRFQEELLNSQDDYQRLLDVSPDGIFVHDKGNILYANEAIAVIAHVNGPKELIGKSIFDFINDDEYENTAADIEAILRGKFKGYRETKLNLAKNISVDIEFANIVTTYKGRTAIMTILRDISRRKQMAQKLSEVQDKYRDIVEGNLMGVYIFQNDKFIYANKRTEDLIGYTLEELYQVDFLDLIEAEDHIRVLELKDRLLNDTKEQILELKVIKKDQGVRNIQLHAKATIYNGSPAIIGMIIDITEHKMAEEKIKQMALYDSLTSLPNRYYLNFQLRTIIDVTKNEGTSFGLMFIDLDGFKIINDTMGHGFGDIVLQQASLEIKMCLDEDDFISRYGGDEFVVIIPNTSPNKIEEKVLKIIDRFKNPINIKEQEVFITPSIGVSISPKDSSNAETLIKYADTAMYRAKFLGRNTYVFYTCELHDEIVRRMEMENGLRNALKRGEFEIYYQPQIDISSGRIHGAEALIRWNHPKLGYILPNYFIPLAEESGLIVPIGEWVLKTACSQIKTWQESGLEPINIAVNISNWQISDKNFTNIINQVLTESGLDPKYLELEITESILKNIDELNPVLNELKPLGVKISIDDFGVGYSSLSILQDICIDEIKIDQSFIKNLIDNPKSKAFVKTIVDIGENLNCTVVAEGVETIEQLNFLKQINCSIVQGYLFSKPLPVKEFEKFLMK